MKNTMAVTMVLGALTACGSIAPNTDKPSGFYVGGATKVTGDFGVSTSDTRPQNGGFEVSGVSCKNKLWESAPTRDRAISVLKREVRNAGYNSVYIRSVEQDPNALVKNCWSAIIAYGEAFNQ